MSSQPDAGLSLRCCLVDKGYVLDVVVIRVCQCHSMVSPCSMLSRGVGPCGAHAHDVEHELELHE